VKSTTNIHIALRNIGDSQDRGETFNGTLSESILWMAAKLSKLAMAGRIVVGIGRTQEDALRGIDVKHAGKTALDDDMKSLLDGVFASVDSLEDESTDGSEQETQAVAGDDYVA
jgi:hypothetical protein